MSFHMAEIDMSRKIFELVLGLFPLHSTLHQTNAVYALTDKELAERGLKRRDAAHQIMTNGDWS